ncbi:MAG: tetratricopeptide repeat protein [Saprospiraceae bacterium]
MKYVTVLITIFLLFYSSLVIGQNFFDVKIDSLEILLTQNISDENRVLVLKELAYKNKKKNPTQALLYAQDALSLATRVGYQKGIAEVKHTLGLIQFHLGDYEVALSNYLEALAIRETIKDEVGLGRSYNNIGVIYIEMGELNLAKKYYTRGLIYRRNAKDSIGMAYSYNNLGDVYFKQKKIDKAITHYNIALRLNESFYKPKAKAFTLERLANLYETQDDFENALSNYEEALRLRYETGIEYDIAKTTINLGQLYLRKDNIDKGLNLITKAETITQKLEAKPLLSQVYESLSQAYAKKGNYNQAYDYQIKYNQVRDSLLNTNISNEMLGLQAKYQFEKNERELLEQNNKIANLQRFYAIVVGLLSLGLIVLLFFRYRRQIKVNDYLKTTKSEIEAKNKQLAAYTKELEQFTYIASHDLKEPLRNISGFARLLERRYHDSLDKNGQQFLHQIMGGVEQMTDLLKDLLKYSEVKRLKKEDLKWVNLNDILVNIKTGLNGQLSKNNGQLMINPLPLIHSNNFQMTQLFKNFITNGLKFQKQGQIPIVEIKSKELSDSWEFRIADNGIGIDKNYHDKVFEMFKRLHKKQDYQGTGMGLAICKQIIEQHNGNIRIESEKDEGTTFIFTFPKEIIKNN